MTGDSTKFSLPYDRGRHAQALRAAAGMNREQIMRHAAQVFDAANAARAAYAGRADLAAHVAAVQQALVWASICGYMDAAGAGYFRLAGYDRWERRPSRRLRKCLALLSPVSWARLAGRKPVTFYRFREGPAR